MSSDIKTRNQLTKYQQMPLESLLDYQGYPLSRVKPASLTRIFSMEVPAQVSNISKPPRFGCQALKAQEDLSA